MRFQNSTWKWEVSFKRNGRKKGKQFYLEKCFKQRTLFIQLCYGLILTLYITYNILLDGPGEKVSDQHI